ncbi:MAG: hypothetical protein IH950_16025 [Bacteroidetes bacterium]|nr:hypothetical protein [Bacteroidota bacterium]
MSKINWGKLYQQGRCKAIGVSWTEEELAAVYTEKVPVEYVRAGYLTLKDYEEAKVKFEKDGSKPLNLWDWKELAAEASQCGIKFTDAVSIEYLREQIEAKRNKKAKEKKVQHEDEKKDKKYKK